MRLIFAFIILCLTNQSFALSNLFPTCDSAWAKGSVYDPINVGLRRVYLHTVHHAARISQPIVLRSMNAGFEEHHGHMALRTNNFIGDTEAPPQHLFIDENNRRAIWQSSLEVWGYFHNHFPPQDGAIWKDIVRKKDGKLLFALDTVSEKKWKYIDQFQNPRTNVHYKRCFKMETTYADGLRVSLSYFAPNIGLVYEVNLKRKSHNSIEHDILSETWILPNK